MNEATYTSLNTSGEVYLYSRIQPRASFTLCFQEGNIINVIQPTHIYTLKFVHTDHTTYCTPRSMKLDLFLNLAKPTPSLPSATYRHKNRVRFLILHLQGMWLVVSTSNNTNIYGYWIDSIQLAIVTHENRSGKFHDRSRDGKVYDTPK